MNDVTFASHCFRGYGAARMDGTWKGKGIIHIISMFSSLVATCSTGNCLIPAFCSLVTTPYHNILYHAIQVIDMSHNQKLDRKCMDTNRQLPSLIIIILFNCYPLDRSLRLGRGDQTFCNHRRHHYPLASCCLH